MPTLPDRMSGREKNAVDVNRNLIITAKKNSGHIAKTRVDLPTSIFVLFYYLRLAGLKTALLLDQAF